MFKLFDVELVSPLVQWLGLALFSDEYKTRKYSVSRAKIVEFETCWYTKPVDLTRLTIKLCCSLSTRCQP